VQLLIPALDVHRAVEKVGVDESGVLQLPVNAWNAGWYQWGPVPGAPGDAVIEGHAGYPGKPMMFGKLDSLQKGDQIVVVLADGSHRLFVVVSMLTVPAGSAPAGLGAFSGAPRLTLITCTGHFDKKNYYYSDRLLLQARYVGLA
jgi:LPXTG-site transpeptidase (sortase) family protein